MISQLGACHGNIVVLLVSWAVNTDFPACGQEAGNNSSLLIQTGIHMFNKNIIFVHSLFLLFLAKLNAHHALQV